MTGIIEADALSALVIAYQRPENVSTIIKKIVNSGIKRISVALDYPRIPDLNSIARHKAILEVVNDFASDKSLEFKILEFSQNVGCGVAVTTACDWFFEENQFGIVLEDDCIPTPGFFEYQRHAINQLSINPEIFVISGTRLHKAGDQSNGWELNNYPVFWGWGSSSDRWKFISTQIRKALPRAYRSRGAFSVESQYWRAGSRRVRNGFVDTWDTVVSEIFHRFNLKNLSPAVTYIENIGNDAHATHDMSKLRNTLGASEIFDLPEKIPTYSSHENKRCAKYLYGINPRHYLTTNLTRILDSCFKSRLIGLPFNLRLERARNLYTVSIIGR